MVNSPDGLHLFTWGGTGARGSSCLRVWGLEVNGGAPCSRSTAQPRVSTAALASPTAALSSIPCVRIAVTTGGVGPFLPAWGAEGALVFVPVDRVDTVLAQALEPRRDPGALEALPPHAGPAAGCEMPAIRQ